MGNIRFYKLIAIFSYILLLIKFPLVLLFDKANDNLSSYFIIISFSIATNFISSDLISYKKLNNGINYNELALAILFFSISTSLVYVFYEEFTLIFIIYNIAIFFHSISISRLREINVLYIVLFEIALSLFQILISTAVSFLTNFNLGYSLIISTIIMYFLVYLNLYFKGLVNLKDIPIVNEKKLISINLYFDMFVTQFERFLFSVYLPQVLAYINITSSIINGLKRSIFDDNQMDYLIKFKHIRFNEIAQKYSLVFLFINILFWYFHHINIFESVFFLEFINTIKPNFSLSNVKYIYIIASLYFALTPVSFFVSHHFRNGRFNRKDFLCFLPVLLFSWVVINFIHVNEYFVFILLSITTVHFVLFFYTLSRKYFLLNQFSTLIITVNYIFGYFCSLFYTFY
jgi:hypothetical protein